MVGHDRYAERAELTALAARRTGALIGSEFAPEHEALFDEMTARLRATPEWTYVDCEADIRLTRDGA